MKYEIGLPSVVAHVLYQERERIFNKRAVATAVVIVVTR